MKKIQENTFNLKFYVNPEMLSDQGFKELLRTDLSGEIYLFGPLQRSVMTDSEFPFFRFLLLENSQHEGYERQTIQREIKLAA